MQLLYVGNASDITGHRQNSLPVNRCYVYIYI